MNTATVKEYEDCISRQAAHEAIERWAGSMSVLTVLPTREVRPLLDSIHELPAAIPQPKIGHWIRWYEQKETEWGIEHIPHCRCSECGKEYDPHSSQFMRFCSNCGVKLEEEK